MSNSNKFEIFIKLEEIFFFSNFTKKMLHGQILQWHLPQSNLLNTITQKQYFHFCVILCFTQTWNFISWKNYQVEVLSLQILIFPEQFVIQKFCCVEKSKYHDCAILKMLLTAMSHAYLIFWSFKDKTFFKIAHCWGNVYICKVLKRAHLLTSCIYFLIC